MNDNYHNNDQNQDKLDENTNKQDTEPTEGIAENARQQAQNKQKKKPKNKSGKGGHLASGLFGGVISAVLVAALFLTGIIPGVDSNDHSSANSTNSNQSPESTEVTKTLESDGADEAKNLDDATEAVVGVTRMQEQNIWEPSEKSGTGSGIVYKKEDGEAYVVTNHHVVANAEEVDVSLKNDEQIKAEVLGSDKISDLAVLKINGDKIDTVANIGDSEDVEVGETAIAIGNPLGMKFANTLTKGIVSGLNRSVNMDTSGNGQPDWVSDVIQTDAAINPGNSGGALVNKDGEVIGINSMKIAQTAVEGIGFAIPIDDAMPMIEQLEKDGNITRPFIGISTAPIQQVPPQYRDQIQVPKDVDGGMVIAKVENGSPAASADLRQFDVITKINDKAIEDIVDLREYLYKEAEVGDTVKLEVYRNGKANNVSLKLEERAQN